MESSNLPVPSYTTEGQGSLETAKRLTVTSPESYETAADMLKNVKHSLKKVDELEEEEKRPHLDELQKIRDRYRPSRTYYSQAEAQLKKLISAYNQKQEDLRREQQRKLDEAAAQQRAKLQKAAAKAQASGKAEKAAALAEQAEAVVAPTVQSDTPKVSGVYTIEKWDFEVINADIVPVVYKSVDDKKVRGIVETMKEAAQELLGPGIRVFKKLITASTSKQPE